MNKKNTYYLLIAVFLAGTAFIFFRHRIKENKNELSYYELLNRKGALAQTPEWAHTQTTVRNLYLSVANNPNDSKSALALATIFIKEARITGNFSYYDMAAMKQVNKVLELDPNNFQALTYKALIYLSQHHFGDGLAIATKAQKINPYNSFIYGILVDANVEMGKYNDALSSADKMVSIRPDLRSYSRISYLREIYGDYPGAIAAMNLAVEAGMPGDDGTEWTRIQLGHLYENTGNLDSAEFEYAQSLEYRKGFAPAISGLGHIAFVKKDYQKAIGYYQQADTLVIDYTTKENLAELYKITGQNKKSDSLSSLVVESMSKDAAAAVGNDNIGHYVDRELSYAYLTVGQNEKALEHALAEYNRRPDNIDVNETLAWAYYKNNNVPKAINYMDVALRTNCKNPTLLSYAGIIYAKGGNKIKGKQLLTEAFKNNPGIDPELKTESENVLKIL
ncbi:MAG: transposase [Bacteroidota bacterium]|nr:transposase [Bacteroidota bacterium]